MSTSSYARWLARAYLLLPVLAIMAGIGSLFRFGITGHWDFSPLALAEATVLGIACQALVVGFIFSLVWALDHA